MTSPGLTDFKALLLAAREREKEILADARRARLQLACAWAGRALAWVTLASVASRSLRAKASTAVAVRRSDVQTLAGNLATSRVSVTFDMETEVAEPHRKMLSAFDRLAASNKAWTVQTTQQIDYVKARSFARTVVSRAATRLARRAVALVDTADLPLALSIQNGSSTAFFYPGFVLIGSATKSDFALVDLKDISVSYAGMNFTETEAVASDAVMVGKAWAKSNKDGSRDRRFKDNRQLPIMRYGQMVLNAPGGLNEVLMFSRDETCRDFVTATAVLQRLLAAGPRPRRVEPSSKALPNGGSNPR